MKRLLFLLLVAAAASAAPKRVLYITHAAGFVHDSIPASCSVMQDLGARSGAFEVVCSEDLSLISADALRDFDVLYFFTSGELELSDRQKADLLAFVRDGKGFGGVHSATDTLYAWPEYGELIGAYFNGHPWYREGTILIADPDHPIVKDLAPAFRLLHQTHQFRAFSPSRLPAL